MLQQLRDAWASASDAVRIAIVAALTVVIVAAIVVGVDMTAVWALLGA